MDILQTNKLNNIGEIFYFLVFSALFLKHLTPTGVAGKFDKIAKLSFKDDVDFCDRLLSQKKTAVAPGASFGMPGWMRLSFAVSDDEVKRGTERIVELCQGR